MKALLSRAVRGQGLLEARYEMLEAFYERTWSKAKAGGLEIKSLASLRTWCESWQDKWSRCRLVKLWP